MREFTFDDLTLFMPGSIHVECEYGRNLLCMVDTPPKVEGAAGQRVATWQAHNIFTGEVIDYRVTENLRHYGPRLYAGPQYCTVTDGKASFRFEGDDKLHMVSSKELR